MDGNSRNTWLDEALDELLNAIANDPESRAIFVFKGARILKERIAGGSRASMDLDSNLVEGEYEDHTTDEAQDNISGKIKAALSTHFQNQDPVRYQLDALKMERRPKRDSDNPFPGLEVKIKLKDAMNSHVTNLPQITLDIAAPEELREGSIGPLNVGTSWVFAYELNRIAGEKLRALLQTLPPDQNQNSPRAVRAKDIYDLAFIAKHKPMSDRQFWQSVGTEFKAACHSRSFTYQGPQDFLAYKERASDAYTDDQTIPNDLSFEEVWKSLYAILNILD